MYTFLFVLLMIFLVVAVWFLLGIMIIRENERGVKIRLGKPYAVVESGLRWAPWPIVKVSRYTTGLVELGGKSKKSEERNSLLEFGRAGIFTRKGRSMEKEDLENYGPVNVGADVSLRFFWPLDKNRLINVVKKLPSPNDLEALTDVFEETVLEHVRTVGSQRTWVDLSRDRAKFSCDINESIKNNQQHGILDDVDNLTVVIDHLEIPEELLATIQKQEVARLKKAATVIDAEANKEAIILEGEGNRSKIISEGEGLANARKRLFEAIGKEPQNLQKEILFTLREMAQGTSTTIFFPTKVGEILESALGGGPKMTGPINFKKFVAGLSKSQQSILAKILGGIK